MNIRYKNQYMKEMLSKAFDKKKLPKTFLVNVLKIIKSEKKEKRRIIWPYSNQNISEDVTTEPTRYLSAKRKPFKVGFKGQSHMFGLDFAYFQPKNTTEK